MYCRAMFDWAWLQVCRVSPIKPAAFAPLLAILAVLCRAKPLAFAKDVSDFLSRRATCDHWRGEDGYNEERKAEIACASCQACQGTDAQLASLKRRYRMNAKVMAELDALDLKIEPDDKATAKEWCRHTRKPKGLK